MDTKAKTPVIGMSGTFLPSPEICEEICLTFLEILPNQEPETPSGRYLERVVRANGVLTDFRRDFRKLRRWLKDNTDIGKGGKLTSRSGYTSFRGVTELFTDLEISNELHADILNDPLHAESLARGRVLNSVTNLVLDESSNRLYANGHIIKRPRPVLYDLLRAILYLNGRGTYTNLVMQMTLLERRINHRNLPKYKRELLIWIRQQFPEADIVSEHKSYLIRGINFLLITKT